MRSADLWPFVPIQSQPSQTFEDLRFAAGDVALSISVFDTQDELAFGGARAKPRENSCAHGSQMQQARWRRRKSHPHGWCAHFGAKSRSATNVQASRRVTMMGASRLV